MLKRSRYAFLRTFLSLALLSGPVGACSEDHQPGAKINVPKVVQVKAAALTSIKTPNTAGTDGAQDTPTYVETDEDRYWIKQALKACRHEKFRNFFEAFVRSGAVRDVYTSSSITVSTNGVAKIYPKNRYFDFPVSMSDSKYVSKNSENTGPNLEHLAVSFDQRPGNFYRVDWVRVRLAMTGQADDSKPATAEYYGVPGYLIFKPRDGCWQLIEDTVYEGPFQGKIQNPS